MYSKAFKNRENHLTVFLGMESNVIGVFLWVAVFMVDATIPLSVIAIYPHMKRLEENILVHIVINVTLKTITDIFFNTLYLPTLI